MIVKIKYILVFLYLFDRIYSFELINLKKMCAISLPVIQFMTSNLQDYEMTKKPLLNDKEYAKIISNDISQRQALITADFTRDLYSEKCTFQDEIDIYPIDKYITGTKALFNSELSHVDLIGNVEFAQNNIGSTIYSFKFKELLTFNIPFNPYVYLTGKVELKRSPDGLIETSREYWDEKPITVISKVKFNPEAKIFDYNNL